ncbi:amino acid transporter [Massilia dura]|uniref:Amino acid transporter n=2 Tax=Pseudoduganella dura TaxID=321982 RepID=A0A6I3XIV8_9BURK|nr:amino acid transporter [Pseudoduganella dura]GGY07952.1 amino acid transporter [Pseudoduganella dura]
MLSGAFFKGMAMGGGLIVAIGAQNAFLLRQALQRRYVAMCIVTCICCDVLLIALGAGSVGRAIASSPMLLEVVRIGGALFLVEYGRRAAVSAWRGQSRLVQGDERSLPRRGPVFRAAMALSLLNPHAWLDTVVLLGAIGAQQSGDGRISFTAGAMAASVLWFTSLGLGARGLTRLFARPAAWRMLDALIAMVMWTIAVSLFV